MAKKVEKIEVAGIMLNANEKQVFEKVMELGVVNPVEIAEQMGKSVPSLRSTLARLEKTHGLIKSEPRLFNEKALKVYMKKGE